MNSLPHYLLYPANIFVEKTPYLVTTILGSCVSVCLYDSKLKYGAINHYILPYWNGQDLVTMKYGNMSIIRIIEELLTFGCTYENIVAQIFGGAEVLTGMSVNFHIGKRNIQVAMDILEEFKIPICVSETGGNKGRKITFNTLTGEVKSEIIRKDYIDENIDIKIKKSKI